MSESCNHAVGTATVEYYEEIIHANREPDGQHAFSGWQFCPYCGEDITAAADAMYDAVQEWHRVIDERIAARAKG